MTRAASLARPSAAVPNWSSASGGAHPFPQLLHPLPDYSRRAGQHGRSRKAAAVDVAWGRKERQAGIHSARVRGGSQYRRLPSRLAPAGTQLAGASFWGAVWQ